MLGTASGDGCNCLIDTLRQCLQNSDASIVQCVRACLQGPGFFGVASDTVPPAAVIKDGDYLTLDFHASQILNLLGTNTEACKIVCLDWAHRSSGDAVGNGPRTLYIARVDENHFVPLLQVP